MPSPSDLSATTKGGSLGWTPLRVGLLVAAVYLAAVLPALPLYPLVFEDEVTLNEPAKELALYGKWRSEYFSESRRQADFDRYYFWQPPGQAPFTAVSYRIFGFGVWQTRLPGVVAAAACLVALALISGRIAGPRAALLASVLLATHPQFFRSATNARMDTLCWLGLLAGLGVLLFPASARRSPAWHALAGLCVGLASMMHVLSIAWALGLNLVLLFRRPGWNCWTAFNAACALPGTAWLAWAWPHRETWATQFFHHGASRAATGSPLERIGAEILRNWENQAATPLYLVFVLLGLVLALRGLRSARSEVRDCAALAGVALTFVTFLMGKGSGEYNLYYVIPMLLLAAVSLSHLTTLPGTWPRLAVAGLALSFAWSAVRLLGPVAIAVTVQADARDHERIAREIGQELRPDDLVWGAPEAWYAVTRTGARLREAAGQPDPRRHSVIILPPWRRTDVPAGYMLVRQVGQALPVVQGRTYSSNDYRLLVWRAAPDRP